MRILAIGDIVGKPGREYMFIRIWEESEAKYNIDFVIAKRSRIQLQQTV